VNDQQRSGDQISANISGPVQGQVAVGKDIGQNQQDTSMAIEITAADLAQLGKAFAGLKAQVADQAPPETRAAALERINELETAVKPGKPDLTTIQYVKRWFVKNLPTLAGAVTGVLVHPVVGKIVQAAGDGIAAQFKGIVANEHD
jgi:hypothetical protein